jgi:SAM-dependent methyltransferase
VRSLQKLVDGLQWSRSRSEWSDYAGEHSYDATDYQRKQAFVRNAVSDRFREIVWDLGCNTGDFSRIAAEHAGQVLAMDADHLAVERLYQHSRQHGPANLLPLVYDVANPSPAAGWNLRERKTLVERGSPDLILNLALIHHIVIGANVPLSAYLDWLCDTGADIVIEFVTRDDDMVRKLLRNKLDTYSDYDLAPFEYELRQRFEVVRREELKSGSRVIYYATSR